jgi:hypothetical protein
MTDLPSRECQVRHKPTAAIFHSDPHARCPLGGGGDRHFKAAVSNACGLSDLPMDPRRDVRLTIVGIRPVLARHIKLEVADLTIEIALVNVSLGAVSAGNVKV